MNSDKRLSLIINLATVAVMVVITLVAVAINREKIFGSPEKPEEDLRAQGVSSGDLENPDRPPTEEEPVLSTEDPFGYPPGYIEAPMSDFMRNMFDEAMEIPVSMRKIEPPPEGRSYNLQQKAVPLSELIPEPFGYFGDILLLGDSVTTGFDLYREKLLFCGEAVLRDIHVVALGNYGVYNALLDISAVHPILNGQKTLPEDIIAQKNQKNVFICLGLNDLVWQTPEEFLAYYSALIERIRAKSPEKNIAIMSVTPCVDGHNLSALENGPIAEANNLLLDYAETNGVYFIDYAAAIRNPEENSLPEDFSSDSYTHLTTQAYERLVEYMLYHPIKYYK
ncbi:MAG: GDSL-type esterase/lipase family protein [Oscillospiraceae bacterium]|nr:GDSL-type esterase/lipase family protein [Oscillospiraceae bacterium]